MKPWYMQSKEEIIKSLDVDLEQGLSMAEGARRLSLNGVNELKQGKKDSLIVVFLRQFCDFMVMVLLGAAIISAAFGEMTDAAMIVAIIVLNGVLGFVQEYKAEKSLEALKTLYVDEALVLRDGKKQKVQSRELVVGDLVYLRQGDKVPADIRVLWQRDYQTEESALTGEAKPVSKTADALLENCVLAERKNMCYSASSVSRGQALGVVVATGMDTEMGKIASLLTDAKISQTPLQKRLKSLGKWLIFLCLAVCALVSVVGIVTGGDVYTMVMTGVSLGVASIPEGLPAIVTICLALGVWRLAKGRAIVKRLPAVETLGSTTVICTDKTGTLTENTMSLRSLYINGAWQDAAEISIHETVAEDSIKTMLYCNSLQEVEGTVNGDATETALFLGASALLGEPVRLAPHKEEIAFTAQRRMMSVLVGNISYVKGAPDTILSLCDSFQSSKGTLPLFGKEKETLRRAAQEYSQKGFRVLALAKRGHIKSKAEMEKTLTFLTLVAIEDPIREDVFDAIATAQKAGVKVVMITGDDKGTALSVGKTLGIAESEDEVLLGKDLSLEGKDVQKLAKKTIFPRVAPEDKMKLVRYYKGQNEVVAMTGDGVNDAPALKEADIGIAMGKRGADVAKEAADFILTDDAFNGIVEAIYQGRGIYDNIRKFIRYLLSSNLGEVLTMFLSVLFGLPLPLLPLQILWINLVTDGLPALALGMEPPDAALMEEKPRNVKEGIFSRGLGKKIIGRGILIGITTIFVFLWAVLAYGNIEVARTMAFTTLVFCQLFYVFDCRSELKSHFSLGLFKNPWLLGAVGISVIMQCAAVYLPWCQSVFHTTSLNLEQWGIMIGLTFLPSLFAYISYAVKKQKKSKKKQEKTTVCRNINS